MKQAIVVLLLSAVMLFVYAGITMAQSDGSIYFGDPTCDLFTTLDVYATDDSQSADSFYVVLLYDSPPLIISLGDNPFSAQTLCAPGTPTPNLCAFAPSASLTTPGTKLFSVNIINGNTSAPANVEFYSESTLVSAGQPLSVALSEPVTLCAPNAVGGPLNLQGEKPAAGSGFSIMAVAALLGLSGLVLALRLRQKAS
jgi:hypothetical protein